MTQSGSRASRTRRPAPSSEPAVVEATGPQGPASLPPPVALTQFVLGTALNTMGNTLGLVAQVQSAQLQMLRDLGNVLHTAQQDAQGDLWTFGLPGSRAASQLGGTLASWRQVWRDQVAQTLAAQPTLAQQVPTLQNPLALWNSALVTGSKLLEGWVDTARKTGHAIVVTG